MKILKEAYYSFGAEGKKFGISFFEAASLNIKS